MSEAIDKGFESMIKLLHRSCHEIKAEALLADWENIRRDFLITPEHTPLD